MTLTQEKIKKIAEDLSKIPFDNPKIEKDLNNILSYFELLNEVDTDGVEPTYSVIKKENILRDDVIEKRDFEKQRQELLACSSQQKVADQIAINNIMK